MNERIRELANQADAFADAMDFSGKNYIGLRDEYFAELIVWECIERVRGQYTAQRDQHVRSEREQGRVECGVASVIALEELVQESTDKWYKENILRDKE